jgi:amino acid permease
MLVARTTTGMTRLLSPRRIETYGMAMLGFNGRQLFKASAIAALAIATISLLLIYFIPAPPSTVTMATAFKGSSFKLLWPSIPRHFRTLSR